MKYYPKPELADKARLLEVNSALTLGTTISKVKKGRVQRKDATLNSFIFPFQNS